MIPIISFRMQPLFYLSPSVTKSKNTYDLKGMPTNIVKKEVFYDRPLGQKNERLIKELIEK
jgi:hypothetical protein